MTETNKYDKTIQPITAPPNGLQFGERIDIRITCKDDEKYAIPNILRLVCSHPLDDTKKIEVDSDMFGKKP